MATASTMSIRIMSYNMHGFNQGYLALDDLIATNCYDVLFLQEHWLTPANLSVFDNHFTDYFSVGCSAIAKKCRVWYVTWATFWWCDYFGK